MTVVRCNEREMNCGKWVRTISCQDGDGSGKEAEKKLTGSDIQKRIPWTDVDVIADRQVEDLPQ